MIRKSNVPRVTSDTEAGPTRALWRTVLILALADAAKGKDAGWVNTTDFRLVCALADLDAEAVRRAFEADAARMKRLRAA
jgi:hypothetical protein